jgi:hypothetical protein
LNRTFYIISILIFFISCEKEIDLKSKNSDFETDLKLKNLSGKVKELSQFRANFINPNENQIGKQIPNLKEEFTESGSIKKSEYFDAFGNSLQTIENFYDQNDYLTKRLTISESFPQKMVSLIVSDSIKKKSTQNITLNDSLHYIFIFDYDNFDNIKRQVKIENNDTIVNDYEYKYNDNGKVLWVKEIQNGKDTLNIEQHTYNKNGNVTESINGNKYLKFKTVMEYEDNRVVKIEKYTITGDLQEHLYEIIEYDKLFKPVNQKIYENSKLVKELKNKYEIDDIGNWTEKKVLMKEHFNNSNKFVPIYIESRKIKYWE